MKKLLSLLLALVLIMSLCAVSVSAREADISALKGENPDIAPTSTQEYFYSHEPYADITPTNGWVIGYIGDVDMDDDITVLDATSIQKHSAEIIELSEDSLDLADVDFDWEATVLDAAEIQKWVANMSDNEYITHTLYIDDTLYVTHDAIADFMMDYGDFVEDEDDSNFDYYTYYFYDEENDFEFEIQYFINMDNIDFVVASYDTELGIEYFTRMETFRGTPVFSFYSDATAYDSDSNSLCCYSCGGSAELIDMDDGYVYDINCDSFYSDLDVTFADVEDVVTYSFSLSIDTADYILWDYISGFVTDIFW